MSSRGHDGNIVSIVKRQGAISTQNEILRCTINVQIRWVVGHQVCHRIHTVAWQAGVDEEGLDVMAVASVVALEVQAHARGSLRLAGPGAGGVLEAGRRPGRRPGLGAARLVLVRGERGRRRGRRRGLRGHGHRRAHADRHPEAFVLHHGH